MPIHDLGYRKWEGRTIPPFLRWWVITSVGARLAWKNRWLRRLILFAWMPTLYFGALFFAYEVWVERFSAQTAFWARGFVQDAPIPVALLDEILSDPVAARPKVWAYLLLIFFRAPQTILLVLIIGMVAPPLISHDLRSRAFLLYFSCPIARREYVLGKMAVVWIYVAMITTVPALVLYCVAILLSPSPAVVLNTWFLPLRILLASAILIIPTTAVALAFSALTSASRYASFSWFALWVVSWTAYLALMARYTVVSLFHTLGTAEAWAFGLEKFPESSLAMLGVLTAGSLWFLFSRISAPLKI